MSRPDERRRDYELDALNDQIKLLVQTEQRLHRSQSELDGQLRRMEMLAEFAFRSASEEPPGILAQTVAMLHQVFDLDDAVGILVRPEDDPLVVCGPTLGADAMEAGGRLMSDVKIARVVDIATMGAELRDDVAAVVGHPVDEGALVLMCLRHRGGEKAGGIVAWKVGARRSFYLDDVRDAPGTFLYTIASHAERALEGALLTEAVKHRSEELASTNARLVASLAELEEAQAALLVAQKLEALGRLAGGVAHDFNNLMTVILGQANLIQNDLPNPPEPEAVSGILDAVERASELTTQLLAFGRQQPGRPESVDLSEAVLDTMRVLAPVLGDDIQVSLSTGATVPKVTVDRGQFGQILLNLALNARDAMPDGGGLTVSVRSATSSDLQRAGLSVADTSRRYVALAVEDTGAGMQPEVLQRVFEPFFTTKELGQGTGLGLATVYGLVHQNGGRIVASSEVGRGSAFTVLLPSRDAPAPPAVEGTGRRLVLVVEDQPAIRDLMGKILRRAGYDVVEAADGAEAASLIEDEDVRPEVIVSDVVMPNMGGGELRVRVRVVAPEVPFVFVSGHPLKSLDLPFLDPDLDRYLPKPFSPSALVNLLAEVLGERAESR